MATETAAAAVAATTRWPAQAVLSAVLAVLLLLVVASPLIIDTRMAPGLSSYLWSRQDWPALLVLVTGLLAMRRWAGLGAAYAPRLNAWPIWLTVALLFALAWSGHAWLMSGYNLSRDEQMVLFDADIMTRGDFVARLPADWAAAGAALNRTFVLPGLPADLWVSAYLPGNAALHTLGAALGDAQATAPLLAAVATLLLWQCARTLWPADRAPQMVALLCLLLSAQFLITATTTYAMTAHLTLNLLWLALFLRDRRWSYALLLPVGFLATGLHQPIFHPLFVAPFMWLLVERRQWRVLAWLVAGYAAIGFFWLSWPGIVIASVGLPPSPGANGASYLARLIATLGQWQVYGIWLMALNLLRFAAWQHLLLLPLVFAAVALRWRTDGLVRALALGPILTIAALLILLPYQGHGWGYRYLHGLIGNLCLLAGFGWLELRRRGLDRRRLIVASSVVTLGVISWFGWTAHQMVAPFAAIDRQLAALDADIILIDDQAAPFAQDLVYNPPLLDHRPVRLAGSAMPLASDLRSACKEKRMAFIGARDLAPINALFGQPDSGAHEPATKAHERLQAAGCQDIRP